jgi:TRAP-type C4-dicarboxylate transport system permease small subunit
MSDPDDIKLDPVGRLLHWLCKASAAIGGTVLIAIALMTLSSVIGRAFFSTPIQGDFELVKEACAVCVAAFLPYCQWQKANIIVDFFTTKASGRTQARLDAFGALLLAVAVGLAGWRTGAQALIQRGTGETTMLMGFPVWITYACMVPGLLLTCIVALYMAWRSFTLRDLEAEGAGAPAAEAA